MLRACYRILRLEGSLCFAVITIGADLSDDEVGAAVEAGPPEVKADRDYPSLLADVGFADIEAADVTGDYLATLTSWVQAWDAEAGALRRVVGSGEFDEHQANRRGAMEAVRSGLLRRYLISGTKRRRARSDG